MRGTSSTYGAAFFWIVLVAIALPVLWRTPVAHGGTGGPPFVEQAKDKAKDEYKEDYKVGKREYKWERNGCRYEYKTDKKGFSEKYECK